MRKGILTGSSLAAIATASALSVLATVTLVAGSLYVSGVTRTPNRDGVAPLPVIGEAAGPIIVTAGRSSVARAVSATVPDKLPLAPSVSNAESHMSGTQVAILIDKDRITGHVANAIEGGAGEVTRETTTLDRVEEFVRSVVQPPTGNAIANDITPEDTVTEVVDGTTEAIEEVTEPVEENYSTIDAGSASPSV